MKHTKHSSDKLVELVTRIDKQEAYFCLLNSNHYKNKESKFVWKLGAGIKSSLLENDCINAFEKWKAYRAMHPKRFLMGALSYDLKNDVESKLHSKNPAKIPFPALFFFEPNEVYTSLEWSENVEPNNTISKQNNSNNLQTNLKVHLSKEQYLLKVKELQKHILEGDIYEITFCMEFSLEHSLVNPIDLYFKLNKLSPMPFSALLKIDSKYVICASPERFLKKDGKRLLSQPIKGTIRRKLNFADDQIQMENLRNDPKEKAENVMIVDLVRNDLKKSSKTGSIKVSELFGIHSFPNLHHMISTVESEISENLNPIDALKNTFPMGSMTGTPKIKAMELIEEYEVSQRSLFSGSIGYIDENSDFDFNVIIRSVFYDSESKNLSFQVGSAITLDSIPEKEYEECLLKAEAILNCL